MNYERHIRAIVKTNDGRVVYGITIEEHIAKSLSGVPFIIYQAGSDIICKAVPRG